MGHTTSDLREAYESRTDADLVRIIRRETSVSIEKEAATWTLIARHRPRLIVVGKGILGSQELAEGLVNWVLWKCVLRANLDGPNSNFAGYLFMAMRNHALNYHKKSKNLVFHEDMAIFDRASTP